MWTSVSPNDEIQLFLQAAFLEELCCSKNPTRGVFDFFYLSCRMSLFKVVSALIMCVCMCEECGPYLCLYDVEFH